MLKFIIKANTEKTSKFKLKIPEVNILHPRKNQHEFIEGSWELNENQMFDEKKC